MSENRDVLDEQKEILRSSLEDAIRTPVGRNYLLIRTRELCQSALIALESNDLETLQELANNRECKYARAVQVHLRIRDLILSKESVPVQSKS